MHHFAASLIKTLALRGTAGRVEYALWLVTLFAGWALLDIGYWWMLIVTIPPMEWHLTQVSSLVLFLAWISIMLNRLRDTACNNCWVILPMFVFLSPLLYWIAEALPHIVGELRSPGAAPPYGGEGFIIAITLFGSISPLLAWICSWGFAVPSSSQRAAPMLEVSRAATRGELQKFNVGD